MNHRGIISTRKKEIRKLIFTWKGLLKPKNFICPETMEEAKTFDWLSPRIRIKKHDWYFSEDARNKLGEFVNILYDIPEIGGLTSYNTLLQVTLKFISRGLYLNIKKQKPLDPPSDISYIIQRLLRIRKTYRFIHVIEGIDLQDTTRLTLGDVTVFSYTEEHLGTLLRYCQERNERDFFDVTVSPFVRNHFLGKTCIQCIAFADQQKAREMAYNKIRQVMNVLRFIVCLFAHEIISENRIKICLLNESYQTGEHVICMNESNHGVSLSHGVGRKTVTEMPMGSNRINDITEKCFYRELCYLLLKEEINELEGTILTSIYWIGEAQNDFDHDSAYMKYWTSLETPFSISEDEITQTLAKSISSLIGFSGYDFIEIKDIKEVYKSLKKHYQKRSKIIHRGVRNVVEPYELNEICKYASWSVLSLLAIRERGYENVSQIKEEIEMLYSLI